MYQIAWFSEKYGWVYDERGPGVGFDSYAAASRDAEKACMFYPTKWIIIKVEQVNA